MIDSDPNAPGSDDEAVVAPATAVVVDSASTAKPRRWPWLLALLLLCAFAALLLFALHSLREVTDGRARLDAQTEASRQQVQRLEQELSRLGQEQQRLISRIDSASATNKVLREELLGMGERATLLEEAVARVSQSRLGGESSLRLNEAELLLTMGGTRLALYGDVASTIEAFALAEDALAGLDDPSLVGLRQTLAQELEQLRGLPADPRIAIRSELAALARQLPTLPPPDSSAADNGLVDDAEGAADPEAGASRLAQLFTRLVTVRRYDPQASLLGPSQRQAALATLALQLELAQVALIRNDDDAFRAALTRVQEGMAGLFDPNADSVQHWREQLTQLQQARLEPELPALGATLRELRNLRMVRRAGTEPSRPLSAPPDVQPPTPADTAAPIPVEPALDTQKDAPTHGQTHDTLAEPTTGHGDGVRA